MHTFTFKTYTLQVGGCINGIWDFHSLFCIKALLPSLFFPPLLDFQRQLNSFDSTLIGIFEKLLRLGFLERSKAPLVR
jgi:hypothetical protein